jgi:hypothetical protein
MGIVATLNENSSMGWKKESGVATTKSTSITVNVARGI